MEEVVLKQPEIHDLLSIIAASGYAEELSPCLALKRSYNDEVLFMNATARARHGPSRKTRLMYASQLPNDSGLQRVEQLLQLDWRINQQDSFGKTALHYAILANNPKCVARLLQGPPKSNHKFGPEAEKANLNIRDTIRGFDPLMTASSIDNVEIINLLLDAGANIEAKASVVPRVTPVFLAGLHYCTLAFKELLNRGADPNTVDDIGRAMVIALSLPERHTIKESLDIVRTMFERIHPGTPRKIMDVNVRDPFNGMTALIYLCQSMDIKYVLQSETLDVTIPDFAMKTALHYLCTRHSTNLFTLIAKGSDVNAADEDGYTALMVTIIVPQPNYSVFQDLLSCGAGKSTFWLPNVNTSLANIEGKTALMLAAQRGLVSMVKALHVACPGNIELVDTAGRTALLHAAECGKIKPVKCLLDLGANVNHPTVNFSTALHWAVDGGHIAVIDALLDGGANLEARTRAGETPLMWAAANNNCTDVIKHLLSKGAKLEATDAVGRTPLHLACAHSHPLGTQVLLDAGANMFVRSALGRLPLHMAAAQGDTKSIKILFESNEHGRKTGAYFQHLNVDVVDTAGRTALSYAAERGSMSAVVALLSLNASKSIIDRDIERAYIKALRGNHLKIARLLHPLGPQPELEYEEEIPAPIPEEEPGQ